MNGTMNRKTLAAPKKAAANRAGTPTLGQSEYGKKDRYMIPKDMAALMTDNGYEICGITVSP